MGDVEIQGEKERSPLGVGEGDMEQAEYEEGSSGGSEEEEEEEGPPPRPGRRVTFEERDKLAVEFQERDMYQHSESVYTHVHADLVHVALRLAVSYSVPICVACNGVCIIVCRSTREGSGHDFCIPAGVQQHESQACHKTIGAARGMLYMYIHVHKTQVHVDAYTVEAGRDHVRWHIWP